MPLVPTAWRQLFHSIHQGPGAGHVIQREKAVQPFHAQSALYFRMDEDGFEFRTKDQVLSIPGQVERLDAHTISRQDQASGGLAPQGYRKHPAHAGKTCGIPGQERIKHRFGVATTMKTVAKSFQLRPQFKMVVDFTVEYDDSVAVARGDGLIACG